MHVESAGKRLLNPRAFSGTLDWRLSFTIRKEFALSHIVTIQTRLHDANAVTAACRRLNLAAPAQGTAKLFSGETTGLLVQLPGWQYPAVIDVLTGTVRYDNFEGNWGNPAELERLLQMYAVENSNATEYNSRNISRLLQSNPHNRGTRVVGAGSTHRPARFAIGRRPIMLAASPQRADTSVPPRPQRR